MEGRGWDWEWIEKEGKNLFLIYHFFFKFCVFFVTSVMLGTIKNAKVLKCIVLVLEKLTVEKFS